MTGYQEILTDPSYHGQILCLTTAEVGVYGVAEDDFESDRIQVRGFLVRRLSSHYSSWRSRRSLGDWLRQAGIVTMEGFDTRALTRHLRVRGSMRGLLTTDDSLSERELLDRVRASSGVVGQDFTSVVSRGAATEWKDGEPVRRWYDLAPAAVDAGAGGSAPMATPDGRHVVVFDFGAKNNIAAHLAARGCRVTVVPAATPATAVLAMRPDGVLLSNGPGDPAACEAIVGEIRALLGRVPIGAICLGHQLVALACGARTEKLPFGHRGANHPVLDVGDGSVRVTSQNHGFAVCRDSLEDAGLEITHLSLNDGTVEGFRHRRLPLVSVQYHPEASPGPHDAHDDFFRRLLELMVDAPSTARGEVVCDAAP